MIQTNSAGLRYDGGAARLYTLPRARPFSNADDAAAYEAEGDRMDVDGGEDGDGDEEIGDEEMGEAVGVAVAPAGRGRGGGAGRRWQEEEAGEEEEEEGGEGEGARRSRRKRKSIIDLKAIGDGEWGL